MTLRVPRQLSSQDLALNEVQSNLVALIGSLNQVPILDGKLLEGLTLTAGVPLSIAHGLGRPFKGWQIVRLSYPGATAIVQEATNATPSTTLRLQCAQACALSLWVF